MSRYKLQAALLLMNRRTDLLTRLGAFHSKKASYYHVLPSIWVIKCTFILGESPQGAATVFTQFIFPLLSVGEKKNIHTQRWTFTWRFDAISKWRKTVGCLDGADFHNKAPQSIKNHFTYGGFTSWEWRRVINAKRWNTSFSIRPHSQVDNGCHP